MARKRERSGFVRSLSTLFQNRPAYSAETAESTVPARRSTRKKGAAPRTILLAGAAALGLAAAAAGIFFLLLDPEIPTVSAHEVTWNETPIGTLGDASGLIASYDHWRAEQEYAQGMPYADPSVLSYRAVQVEEDYLFSAEEELLTLAKNATQPRFTGCVLQISGHDIVALKDEASVQEVLDTVKANSLNAVLESLSTEDTPVTELDHYTLEFAEALQTQTRVLTPQDIKTVEQAVVLLSESTQTTQSSYTVSAGDTLAKIASHFQTTQEALLEANPEITSANLIKVGQEIRLRGESRLLNTILKVEYNGRQTVPHTTEKRNSSSLQKGKTKVLQEGVDGIHIIEATDTYLNGAFAHRDVRSEVVEKEMVPEIIQVGTMVINSRGNPVFPYPVSGYRISSRFGPRNIAIGSSNHKGIDLAVPMGTPVYASADGKVAFSGEATGYGLVVYIDHDNGYQTRYAHNSRLVVKKGETVKKGQLIAYAGNTGVSSGPHCHFEIRKNGTAVNPEHYQ